MPEEPPRRARGMDSERLSARTKQPGHDRSFATSETNFIAAARECLDSEQYEILDHPRELANLFPGELAGDRDLGVIPEAAIISKQTGRRFFVEVKKQGDAGNADERACKHHTVQFYKCLHERFGYDYHPFVTVMCESLALNPRYTRKAVYLFEPEQYCLWTNYSLEVLCQYLTDRCAEWLDDSDVVT
jgi:hypothetical protein